ncbi:hypothetical protein E6C60_0287 [Paenibacillus algicola]|uniref:Uncharacterized protein n=1 Tax=Paenibacillus algicola TaxID=2565926 RepID=A0A4P8XF73_9BACL|nr:hypothetical protein [Paenibacillus algicola]QCT01012.1 hypothetical protein E6C60_0287 [Paenibacillus algicola]
MPEVSIFSVEGDELLTKFRERQAALRGAVKSLISESKEAAREFKQDNQTEEIFSDILEN